MPPTLSSTKDTPIVTGSRHCIRRSARTEYASPGSPDRRGPDAERALVPVSHEGAEEALRSEPRESEVTSGDRKSPLKSIQNHSAHICPSSMRIPLDVKIE